MPKNVEKAGLDWHSGFYAAMRLELLNEPFTIEREYLLNEQPIRIDVLVKNQNNFISNNEVAQIFRKINVIEYKSPEDSLTIEDYFKTLAYAGLYIGNSKPASIHPQDVTLTLCREAYPANLIRKLELLGYKISRFRNGIYYVIGKTPFPTQIIVTRELNKGQHSAYKMLTKSLELQEAKEFVRYAKGLDNIEAQKLADAVLEVSIKANAEVFDKVRSDAKMCEALRELMKDDLLQAEKSGKVETLYSLIKQNLLTVAVAAAQLDMTEEEFLEAGKKFGLSL